MRRRLLIILLALGFLVAACGDDGGGETGEAATTSTVAGTDAASDDADAGDAPTTGDDETAESDEAATDEVDTEALSAAIFEEIDAWMTEGEIDVPGLTLTVLLPDDELRMARGVADLRTDALVTPDSYFRIGSVTKTITSVAILQLVDEGLLDLDEPVATYLGPGWLAGYELDGVDYGDQVTVRQILDHTDGFKEFAWDPGFYLQTSLRLDQAYKPQELIDWAVDQGPLFVPGEDYSYNTVGHVAAGLLIEEITGNEAHEELRRRVYEPLGLDNIFLPPGERPPNPVVHGYAVGELKTVLNAIPATEQYRDVGEIGEYYDMSVIPQEAITSAGWTGGGIEAQSADVAAIFRGIFDGTLLSDEMIAELTTTNPYSDYGLGLTVGTDLDQTAYSHGGGVPGFRSHAVYWPDLDIALAMSANAVPIEPDVGVLAERILAVLTEG